MYVKAKQLHHSETWAFGSALHFNALDMKNTAPWLRYVPCSLTFKNSAFCNQSLHMDFILFSKKIPRHIINLFVFVTETVFYMRLVLGFDVLFR
jgi:hypothetical protein